MWAPCDRRGATAGAAAFVLLLTAQALAESHNKMVEVETCYVDYTASPPEARPAGEEPILILPGLVASIQALPRSVVGVTCTILYGTTGARRYVVGTREEMMDLLGFEKRP